MDAALQKLIEAARDALHALNAHHLWHQCSEAELALGYDAAGEPITLPVADCYVDSALEEQTTAAIIQLRNLLGERLEEAPGARQVVLAELRWKERALGELERLHEQLADGQRATHD